MSDFQDIRDRAYHHFSAGELGETLSLLTELEAKAGVDAELANDLGVVLFRMGDHLAALRRFQQSAALEGESLVAGNLIGLLAEQVQQNQSQQEELEAFVAARAKPSAFETLGSELFSRSLGLWQKDSARALHKAASALSDEQWLEALHGSVEGQALDGHFLPGFIDPEMQRIYVGSSGVAALNEANRFIRLMLDYARDNGLVFDERTRAVDFGSGWGRYTRFMLKYIQPDNLYGLEVNPGMTEHCRKAFGMGNFLKVENFPPCDLREDLVDLIFGYSVFSHLAPDCADAWIKEFARITRPGALVLMTTQGRDFIEFCRRIRASNDRSHPWYANLADSFVDPEQAYGDYDAGAFLHAGFGQYDGTYGESLISRGYIEQNWLEDFELIDFVDDRHVLPQALFVLRRKARG